MNILKFTGFKTVTEYYEETTYLDRAFFRRAIPEYEKREAKKWGME